MRARSRHGFTLIEAVIVVAIIGIIAALSVFSLIKSRETVSMEKATSQIRGAFEEARSLAAIAGSRAGTPRLIIDGSCGASLPNQVTVIIDPGAGTVVYPSSVTNDPVTSNMTVFCTTWSLANVRQTGSTAAFVAPAAVTTFGFAPTGHLIINPPQPVYVRIEAPNNTVNTGIRVLQSGVLCQSSDPTGAVPCDESTNW